VTRCERVVPVRCSSVTWLVMRWRGRHVGSSLHPPCLACARTHRPAGRHRTV